jgi:hypothetical protein
MPGKFIGNLRTVDDLADGHVAVPEKDTAYEVYRDPGDAKLPVRVVLRRGPHLFAVTDGGEEFRISGEGAEHQIQPRYVGRDRFLRRLYGGR